eukprot:765087-Hanusia_phi.AAC.2
MDAMVATQRAGGLFLLAMLSLATCPCALKVTRYEPRLVPRNSSQLSYTRREVNATFVNSMTTAVMSIPRSLSRVFLPQPDQNVSKTMLEERTVLQQSRRFERVELHETHTFVRNDKELRQQSSCVTVLEQKHVQIHEQRLYSERTVYGESRTFAGPAAGRSADTTGGADVLSLPEAPAFRRERGAANTASDEETMCGKSACRPLKAQAALAAPPEPRAREAANNVTQTAVRCYTHVASSSHACCSLFIHPSTRGYSGEKRLRLGDMINGEKACGAVVQPIREVGYSYQKRAQGGGSIDEEGKSLSETRSYHMPTTFQSMNTVSPKVMSRSIFSTSHVRSSK